MKMKHIILLLLFMTSALFANSVAAITAIQGKAIVQRDTKQIPATLGAKLENKDILITKERTKVQMIFNDETIVTIGKNSHFSIEEYIMGDSSSSSVKFNLLEGAMRTITGKIGKIAPEKFSVKTKTALIGIRGTNFTILEDKDTSQQIYCTYGAIDIAINNKHFMVHQGFFLKISPNLTTKLQAFTTHDLKNLNNAHFGKSIMHKKQRENEHDRADNDNSKRVVRQERENKPEGLKNANFNKPAIGEKEISKSEGIVKATPIDNTTATNNYVALKNTSYLQKQAFDARKEEDAQNESEKPAHTPTAEPLTEMSMGYASKSDAASQDLQLVYLNAADKFVNGVSGTNIFYMLNANNNIGTIFNLASAPRSFNENFSTTFTDVHTRDIHGNLLATGSIDTSSFHVSADDLSPNDSMHWGDWAVTYTINGKTNQDNGFWTAGENTPDLGTLQSKIASYTLNEVAYKGIYRAIRNSSEIVNGAAFMNVNFGEGTASLVIDQPGSASKWASYSMLIDTVDTASIKGTQDGSISGAGAIGLFYGETGNDIGGSFSVENPSGSIEAKGVYQVHTNTVLH